MSFWSYEYAREIVDSPAKSTCPAGHEEGQFMPKLAVGGADNEFEREADRVAAAAVGDGSVPGIQRMCAGCEKEEETVQRQAATAEKPAAATGAAAAPAPAEAAAPCMPTLADADFDTVFKLDTITVIQYGDVGGALDGACAKYKGVQHPFRVQFFDIDPAANPKTAARFHVKPGTPRVQIYVERGLETDLEGKQSADVYEKRLKEIIDNASTSPTLKGLKTGSIVGGIVGAVVGIVAGLAGMPIGAAALLGSAVGAGILGAGALIGYMFGTSRGTSGIDKDRVKEVTAYVNGLEQRATILDSMDADNMARIAVQLWVEGALPLSVKVRRLLIKEMLSGFTGDDDERAIIKLLENSKDAEIIELLDPAKGLSFADIESDIHGKEHKDFMAMLRARLPHMKETERIEQRGDLACSAEETLTIQYARTLAPQMIRTARARLAELFRAPEKNPEIAKLVECYFPQDPKMDLRHRLGQIDARYQLMMDQMKDREFVCPGYKQFEEGGTAGKCSSEMDEAGNEVVTLAITSLDRTKNIISPRTKVCPPFFEMTPDNQARRVVHEWAHQAAALGKETYEPACGALKLDDALDNADSYAMLAYELWKLGGGK